MEEWEVDFNWLKIRHYIKDKFRRTELPDLNGILFLIGMQEFGRIKESFTKEQKQDLMHIAVCRLLAEDDYYRFVGRDEDGWPHYELVKKISKISLKDQSTLLKEKIIKYFKDLDSENTNTFPDSQLN